MELEDLKDYWNSVNKQSEKEQQITSNMINQATRKKYSSMVKRIAYPEITGISFCLFSILFLAINFRNLNTDFLNGVGGVSIILLISLCIISSISLRQFNTTEDMNKPYSETLRKFAVKIFRFHKLQKINFMLCYLLLLTTVILLPKFFSGKDITDNKYFLTFSIISGYIFLLFYSTFVLNYYKKTIRQTEELLKELQSY